MTTQKTASPPPLVAVFWLYVGIPLIWGIWETLLKATALFQ